MRKFSLDALARRHLEQAAGAASGRSAETVYGGHERTLRQTLIALTAGSALGDHPNPGDATVAVLRGRVELTTEADSWEGRTGDMLIVPEEKHGLRALEDSVVLLSIAKT
ncbi:cupin domain-containing protein [Nocardiopsis potens]|uniref:cupin domain-containing protein n=1 Tax=Nocardiopsis potens TaxID=1246458 RepID=UPI0003455FA4|nr:cupin domain-containing protein [Nocardiopsis potens]